MSTELEQLEQAKILLGSAIAETFDAPVHDILAINSDDKNNLYGYLLSDGGLYKYDITNVSISRHQPTIELNYLPNETQELNEYTSGFLAANGIHTDSEQPYEWARGFYRVDALKCSPGNIPCGNRCLPKGQKCRSAMGKDASRQAARIGGLVAGAAISAGVVGAGAAAIHAARTANAAAQHVGRAAIRGAENAGDAGKNTRQGVANAVETAKERVAEAHAAAIQTGRKAEVMARRAMGKDGRKAVKQTAANAQQAATEVSRNVEKASKAAKKAGIKARRTAKNVAEDIEAKIKTQKEVDASTTVPSKGTKTVNAKAKTIRKRKSKI